MGPLLDAPWAPVFLAVLWFMHPWLGIFAVSMAIVLLIVMVVGDLATRRKTREGDSHQARAHRSEEHTSELQSLMRISYAVFCLNKKIHTLSDTQPSHDLHQH